MFRNCVHGNKHWQGTEQKKHCKFMIHILCGILRDEFFFFFLLFSSFVQHAICKDESFWRAHTFDLMMSLNALAKFKRQKPAIRNEMRTKNKMAEIKCHANIGIVKTQRKHANGNPV